MGRIINKPEQLRDYQIAIYNRWASYCFQPPPLPKAGMEFIKVAVARLERINMLFNMLAKPERSISRKGVWR